MPRSRGNYTDRGRRIMDLAVNQMEVAKVLGLSQQVISFKLRGKVEFSLKDLKALAEHFDVPLVYFVSAHPITVGQADMWSKMVAGPPELYQAMQMACSLPRPFAIQLLRIVQAMNETVIPYPDLASRESTAE